MEKHYTVLMLAVLLIGMAQQTFAQTCPARNEAAAQAEDQSRNCRSECTLDTDCTGVKTCTCDDLCGLSCFNPDADCDPLTLTDGTVSYSDGQNYNSQATHTCDSGGFYLSGQKVRICRSTRQWSHSHNVPNCTQGCPTPATSLGNAFLLDGEIMGASAYPVGHVITYQCQTGYNPSGSDFTRTCQADFTWTNAQYTCTIVNCGAPPSISDGSHTGNDYEFGGTVVYSCDPGYDIKGSHTSFQCRSSGLWEPENSWPTCEPVTCLPPDAPDNGNVVASAPYEFGDIARYDCDPGYILNGPTTGTCDENSDWGTVPTCDVTLDANFDGGHTDGYTVTDESSWKRESVTSGSEGLPTTVLTGSGTVRSLAYPLTGDGKVCMEAAVSKLDKANQLEAQAFNGASMKLLHTFTATGDTWETEKFWLVPVVSTDTTVQLQFVSTNVNAELDNIKQLDASDCATPTPPTTAPSTEPTTTPDDGTTTAVSTTTAVETTSPAPTTTPSAAPSTTTTRLVLSSVPASTPDDERTTPDTSTTADVDPPPPDEITTPQPDGDTTTTTTTSSTLQPGPTTTTMSTTTSTTTSAATTTPGLDESTEAPGSGLVGWAIALIVIFSVGFLVGVAVVLVIFVFKPATAKTYTAGSNGVTPVETPESPPGPAPTSTEL